jgi:redox-sensitive bicupin YhaK (pirin superfamily)
MIEPSYQELKDKDMPRSSINGVHVKVIAGESMGVKSPVYTRTPTTYLDFTVDAYGQFSQPIPRGWNAFVYIISGYGSFGSKGIEGKEAQTLLFSDGDIVQFKNPYSTQLRFVLIAGQPLNEPGKFRDHMHRPYKIVLIFIDCHLFLYLLSVAQHGPFVMNTQAELEQTFLDYRNGKNGFEKALTWRSDYLTTGHR